MSATGPKTLILVRHGNTFGPSDKTVWAGARTDLPLVEKGRQQAAQMGQTLAKLAFRADRFLTGPLLRTREHADIIADSIGFTGSIEIDEALCEIDYGAWEGLSTEEIHALGGQAALTAWNTGATWPETAGWSPEEDQIKTKTAALLSGLAKDMQTANALLVTSNGILRFFARQCANPPATDALKVRTGHACKITHDKNEWRITHWNAPPDQAF